MKNEEMNVLFSSLASSLDTEDLQLSVLQGLIAGEISMKRQELGMSQKDLADKLSVSQGLVSRWEKGETNFSLSTIVRIAAALGLSVQSPIVPSPPISYSLRNSNIINFSGANSWQSGSRSLDHFDASPAEDSELEEM